MRWGRPLWLDCSLALLPIACSIQRNGTGTDLGDDTVDASQASSEVGAGGEMAGGGMESGGAGVGLPTDARSGSPIDSMRSDVVSQPEAGVVDAQSPVPTEGLLLWLGADEGVVEVAGHVATWHDGSGNHNDATQMDASLRPEIATSWHAGRPAVAFDGVAEFLQLPAVFTRFPQGLTMFVAGDVANGSDCPSFLHFSNGGENDDISLHIEANDTFGYEVQDEFTGSKNGAAPANQPLLLDVVHRPDQEASLFSGGTLAAKGMMMLPAETPRSIDDIGRSSYAGCAILSGHIAEVIVYRRAIADSERAAIEGYLKERWAL